MRRLARIILRSAAVTALALSFVPSVSAQTTPGSGAGKGPIKIAVVDLNTALNNSEAGKRSKRILLTDKDQMEDELKAQEADLKKRADDLKNNVLLTEAARAQKESELRDAERKLRDSVQRAQKELQDKERRYTESIFSELKTVIGVVAKDQGYDVVLEKNASQVILFSQFELVDITDRVITRYDTIQN
jgi:outer membrane protein